jgi:hypothetical protein
MSDKETREKRKKAIEAFACKAIPTVFLNETAKRLKIINPEFNPELMEAYHQGFCYALELVLNGDLNMKETIHE